MAAHSPRARPRELLEPLGDPDPQRLVQQLHSPPNLEGEVPKDVVLLASDAEGRLVPPELR